MRQGSSAHLVLVWFLLVLVTQSEARGDLVFLIERSQNTRAALAALHLGSQEHFAETNGRILDPLGTFIYTYTGDDDLERVIAGSSDPDVVVGAFSQLKDASVEDCWNGCCCGHRFPDHFEAILEQHLGATIMVLVDCVAQLNSTVTRDWNNRISKSNTRVFISKPAQSYCDTVGSPLDTFHFTEYLIRLSSESFKALYTLGYLEYRSSTSSSTYATVCSNESNTATVYDGIRRFSHLLHRGRANQALKILDPNGSPWTKNIHYEIDDATGVQLVNIYSDCLPGWTFWNGKCLYKEPRRLSYEQAKANCQSKSATLLTQFSPADQLPEEFFTMDSEAGEDGISLDLGRLWLALDDQANRRLHWSLLKGFISMANTAYSNWAPGEPNASVLGARCASVNRRNQWSTGYCKSLMGSICVAPAYLYDVPMNNTQSLPSGRWKVFVDSYPTCLIRSTAFY